MPIDCNSNQIKDDCDSPAVWVFPAALQELVDCGDADLVQELIAIFQTDTAARLEVLSRAVAEADFATVRAETHTVKGSAVQVGAHQLADSCQKMELEARKSPPGDLVQLLGCVLHSFEQVRAVIASSPQGAPSGRN